MITTNFIYYYYLAHALSLILGIIFVLVWLKWPRLALLSAALIFSLLVVAAVFIDYSFLACILSFVIPVLGAYTARFFLRIPVRVYKIWQYPIDVEIPDLDMIDLSQMQVVQFVLSKQASNQSSDRASGQVLVNFTAKAPLNMTLGQLFFIFINDYNEKNPHQPIIYVDAENHPHGWLFHRRKGLFRLKYYFDPDVSFHANGIRPNEFIYSFRD